MPYRKVKFLNGGFYHVFNRGVEKRLIFLEEKDNDRFLAVLHYYKYKRNIRYSFRSDMQLKSEEDKGEKLIDVISYCLMPNHFHLLLQQNVDKGISNFLRLIQNSYTRYFNTKYKRNGHLFQGMFKAVQIESDEQLLHVTRYIHLNPFVSNLVKDPKEFRWSSHKEYLSAHLNSIDKQAVLSHFKTAHAFDEFINDHAEYAKTIHGLKDSFFEY